VLAPHVPSLVFPLGLKPLVNLGTVRSAEAPLFAGGVGIAARLNVVHFQVVPFYWHRQGGHKVRSKVKINVKGNGQECPFHSCRSGTGVPVKICKGLEMY